MMFVNQIAEVVHSQVNAYGGQINKNIGEAFLLVWKFHDKDVIKTDRGKLKLEKSSRSKSVVADLALFGFLKVIAKINKFVHIIDYENDYRLS